jgi:DNA (cytosine-5)-methyltransferase 1
VFDWRDVAMPPASAAPRLSSILHPTDGSGVVEEPYTDDEGRPASKYVLSSHLWEYLQNYASKHKAKGNGFGFGLVTGDDVARTLSARYYKDGSEILVKRGRGNPRRLTPRECARLMGFDAPGSEPFKIPVSDTQAYRQFGNAVAVPVVTAIAKALVPYLRGEKVGTGLEQMLELAAG